MYLRREATSVMLLMKKIDHQVCVSCESQGLISLLAHPLVRYCQFGMSRVNHSDLPSYCAQLTYELCYGSEVNYEFKSCG